MIFEHVLEIYALLLASVFLHELGHFAVAKIIGLYNITLHIGDRFFSVHIGRFYISPFKGGGIDYYDEDLSRFSIYKKVMFFGSGVFVNLLMLAAGYIWSKSNVLYGDSFIWLNVYLIIQNIIPLKWLDNDGYKIWLTCFKNK